MEAISNNEEIIDDHRSCSRCLYLSMDRILDFIYSPLSNRRISGSVTDPGPAGAPRGNSTDQREKQTLKPENPLIDGE